MATRSGRCRAWSARRSGAATAPPASACSSPTRARPRGGASPLSSRAIRSGRKSPDRSARDEEREAGWSERPRHHQRARGTGGRELRGAAHGRVHVGAGNGPEPEPGEELGGRLGQEVDGAHAAAAGEVEGGGGERGAESPAALLGRDCDGAEQGGGAVQLEGRRPDKSRPGFSGERRGDVRAEPVAREPRLLEQLEDRGAGRGGGGRDDRRHWLLLGRETGDTVRNMMTFASLVSNRNGNVNPGGRAA